MVTHQVYEVDPVAQTIGTQGNCKQKCRWNHHARRRADAFFTRGRRRLFCVPYLGFVNAYCTTMPGLLIAVAVLALLVAASIVLDRMVPDEPAGKHARAHARERRP